MLIISKFAFPFVGRRAINYLISELADFSLRLKMRNEQSKHAEIKCTFLPDAQNEELVMINKNASQAAHQKH